MTELDRHMADAERKAWDALSRYKFQMFGYWAAIWVHLNQISGARKPNPFKRAVMLARDVVEAEAEDRRDAEIAERERGLDQILDERERTGL
jgi:hypothetical protein